MQQKGKKLLVVLIILFLLVDTWLSLFLLDFKKPAVSLGVTFSQKYAQELKLDWRQAYLAILDDLKVDHLRLIAYWDQIEAKLDELDFSDLDWQISEAAKRNVNVVLVVGRRLPRWPECHDPGWLAKLAPLAVQQQQLEFVQAVVERYKDNPAIKKWQIENEPLFGIFGHCPLPDKKFLIQEIELVKSLDSRPIVVTDSGELSHWQGVAGLADILGITMYRLVWNPQMGFWDYWFVPAAFYHYKASLTQFFHQNLKGVMVTELQMEPWTFNRPMVELTLAEQEQSFDLKRFKDNVGYVEKTGFAEVYLWGAEYWYWLKAKGYPEIWEEAKGLWK